VVASNVELDSSPELVNSDPYGAGWMIEVRLADATSPESLLDSSGYRELIEQ
jgi:glycine cleavage system H protein